VGKAVEDGLYGDTYKLLIERQKRLAMKKWGKERGKIYYRSSAQERSTGESV